MALTTIESNNKLVQFTKEINREFVRENLFSPYMGDDLNSIIRRRYEPKQGGEQMNIPLVTKLTNAAIGVGTLVGNEEKIDNYGMRVWLDWARNAVTTNKAESQKDSADVFGEAKPLLSDWGKELQRDELLAALLALPSESAPTDLGTSGGQRANGILYNAATTTQRDTWNVANSDRVLYGNLTSNYNATHATALGNIDISADLLTGASLSLMKRIAMNASPAIKPYKTKDGYEYYVCFAGTNTFRDLKADSAILNSRLYAMNRDKGESSNPLFQDGDVVYDGVICRQVPEISGMVTDVWTSLVTAGATSSRVEPVFFCGQQAAVMAWGQMAKPTFRKEDDYGFIQGAGVEMAYGVAKMFKKHPNTSSNLKQWGVVTGFFRGAAD
jgi:N4-gp56 family major capsid protein